MREPASEPDAEGGILVPVGESVTLRNTVAYAVRVAEERDASTIHFVTPVAWRDVGEASAGPRGETERLLDRVSVWAREDVGDADIEVETAILGLDEYLFSPDDYSRSIAAYADARGLERVVVDPEYSPGGNVPLLRPVEVDLVRRGLTVEEAPVEQPTRRGQFVGRGSVASFGILFVVAFGFYQLLGGFAVVTGDTFDFWYELLTGTIAAAIVAGALHRVTISGEPQPIRTLVRIARLCLYVPYLVYEIVKSNIVITYIILHPRLPIEPRMTHVRTAVWGGPAITTLANSITLTPGTLTVRNDGNDLYVHALFPSAREGLFDGALERAVRFVFYGRAAAAIATPEERGDCEILTDSGGADAEREVESDA